MTARSDKIITLIFSLVSFCVMAQHNTYSRVKIYADGNGLKNLSEKGVAIDHGTCKRNTYFISDFSSRELATIKSSGYQYEILIPDVSQYYKTRNAVLAKNESDENSLECKYCADYKTPANFKLGSMSGFYTYNEMLAILDSMASKYPSLISIKHPVSDSVTIEGRPVFYLKISDNPGVKENEPEILFTSLHHAREPESLSQLIFFMWYLLENYGTNAEVTYIVNHLELYFIPCVNPDGYIYNQTTDPAGGGMWRKNRRNNSDGSFGVNLNRNYGYHFGLDNSGSSPVPADDSYRGISGFSEPETQMIRDFCKQHQFKVAVNNHTFGDHLVMPWDSEFRLATPDSVLYEEMAQQLTYCNAFDYGTPFQTFGYLANGGSNDWMYGEQSEKNKIFTFSPEAGLPDDGFWPASFRITELAKVSMLMNMNACKLAGTYAQAENADEIFLAQKNGYIKYNLTKMGLEEGAFLVSIEAIDNNVFSFIGQPKSYSSLNRTLLDSIPYTLVNTVTNGDKINYVIRVNNGAYDEVDTVKRVFGSPSVQFYDEFNSAAAWDIGTWGLTNSAFHSAPSCITDSPDDFYHDNEDKSITTLSFIDLTHAKAAWLNFNAAWDIEKNFDYAEVLVSTNGTSYTPMCGKWTRKGSDNQDLNKPILDATTPGWIKETVDLSDYTGKNIKLRFKLKTDFGETRDGIYIDDVMVSMISEFNTGVASDLSASYKIEQNIPNPFSSSTSISYSLPSETKNAVLEVFNQVGEKVIVTKLEDITGKLELNMEGYAQGIYFYGMAGTNSRSAMHKLVLIKK